MLLITVTMVPERWDEEKGEFIPPKTKTLQLEHSLVSLSKWESKWQKPFLSQSEMTAEETIDYIKCMTITQNVDQKVYEHLSAKNIRDILSYIKAPMTATTFRDDRSSRANQEIVTAELIYYWMIAMNIPFDCRKWHLNQLMTLIRVCNIKNQKPKKRKTGEIMSHNAALNAARKKKWNTKG